MGCPTEGRFSAAVDERLTSRFPGVVGDNRWFIL